MGFPGPGGFAPHGLHWLGLGVLATTLVRKGKGDAAFWFGLGALVTGLFMKRRLALLSGPHHGGPPGPGSPFGGPRGFGWGARHRGRRGGNWKFTVVADASEKGGEESTDDEQECRECAKASDRVCDCNPVERSEEEVIFDADQDAKDAPVNAAPATETDAKDAHLVSLPLTPL